MEDSLRRLLDAESNAEKIARQAEEARDALIQNALNEARVEEQRFEARVPELHHAFIEKGESRAEQTIKELRRRYEERHERLRSVSGEHQDDALGAAMELLLKSGTPD
jgi:V/A-type H+/Na+-transporting ATPase subunit G/H